MEKNFIVRNGELEHVWQFRIVAHGFNSYLYCRGTESEVRAYINSEYPHNEGFYHAVSDAEEEMLKKLGITVYIAPKF